MYVCILYAPRHQVIGQSTELLQVSFLYTYCNIYTNTDTCVRCWYCMIYAHDFICLCCDTFMHTHCALHFNVLLPYKQSKAKVDRASQGLCLVEADAVPIPVL